MLCTHLSCRLTCSVAYTAKVTKQYMEIILASGWLKFGLLTVRFATVTWLVAVNFFVVSTTLNPDEI